MTESFVGPDGSVYEVVEDEDEFDLDEPLTRADFRAWVQAQQQGQGDYEYDDEEPDEEEEAYWAELAQHVEDYEKARGHPMSYRELETFVDRFNETPEGRNVDISDGFFNEIGDDEGRVTYLADTMEGLQAEQAEAEGEGEPE